MTPEQKKLTIKMGESLRKARRSCAMQQKELAELSGLSVYSISNYEKGITRPRLDAALFIADALEMSLEEVFTGSKVPFRKKVMSYTDIGHSMRMCRRAHRLTMENLSGKTGIAMHVLHRCETGAAFSTMDSFIIITSHLGVTIDEYIGRV